MLDDVTYGALAVPSRRRLLEVLRDADDRLDLPALATATGLHPNTVRFHLDVLVRAGFVEERRERRGTRGRPRMLYGPAASVQHETGYQLLAGMLVSHLDETGDGAAAENAGRAWARRIASNTTPVRDPVATSRRVVALFTELGFDPATAGSETRISLRACPFRALAEQHQGVVCSLHRGLLRELVGQTTAGSMNADLTPFVQPHLCVVDLTTAETPAAA